MKKSMKRSNQDFKELFLLPFLAFLLLASVVAMGVQAQFPKVHPATVISLLTFAAFMYAVITHKHKGTTKYSGFRMGVEVEIWANYIIERLWKDNKFLQFFFSDDDKVLAGKIVHIPQPGAKPTTMKNRTVFPATAVRRVDTDILYPLDEYTTDPTHITDADKVELSYDKINSVYGDHAGTLVEDVAGDAIAKYLTGIPQANIIPTDGANTTEVLEGATGTRKSLTASLLRKMKAKANKQNVKREERYAMLSSDMYSQLEADLGATQYREFSATADPVNGIVGKLYGWTVLERSFVAAASVDGGVYTIKPYGAAIEADDLDVSFFWQKDCAARAIGEVKFFENPDRAEFYGDVYSALLRFGGRRRRENSEGVYAVVGVA